MGVTLVVIIAVLVFLVLFSGIGIYTSRQILYPKMKDSAYYENIRNKYNTFTMDEYNNLDKEDFYIKSKYGYDIHMNYIKNETPSEHTIIISHGVTTRIEQVIKFLNMFLKNGYNVLIIESRAHGKTGGEKVSYGYYEKHDLAEAIKWVREKSTGKIGLIGESMGAGISMQTMIIEDVDFLIEDCGYSDFSAQVKHLFKLKNLIPVYPTYWFARFFVYLMGGFDLNKVCPLEAIKQVDIPIMVVHGEEDDYVPYYMASIIYDNIKSKCKMMFSAEDTDHALSYDEHPMEYEQKVHEFLKMSGLPCSKDFAA